MKPPTLSWFAHTRPMMNPALIRHGLASWHDAHFLLALDETRTSRRDLLVTLLTPCCLAKGDPWHGRGLRCFRCAKIVPVQPDIASLLFLHKHGHTDETLDAALILDSWLSNYAVDPLEQVMAAHQLVDLFRSIVEATVDIELPQVKTDAVLDLARATITAVPA